MEWRTAAITAEVRISQIRPTRLRNQSRVCSMGSPKNLLSLRLSAERGDSLLSGSTGVTKGLRFVDWEQMGEPEEKAFVLTAVGAGHILREKHMEDCGFMRFGFGSIGSQGPSTAQRQKAPLLRSG